MQKKFSKGRQVGFTLIELIIAITIIGILVKVALPSYMSQIQQSRRSSAKSALLDLAGREARYYSTNNVYTATLTNLGYSGSPVLVPSSTSDYYSMTVVTGTGAATFTGLATAVNSQTTDACLNYTINNFGVKGNQDTSGTAISNANCW